MELDKNGKLVYRLEFSVSQQQWHLDNFTHTANTNGWRTISEKINDDDFKAFECYLNRSNKKKYTILYLINEWASFRVFQFDLTEYNLYIKRCLNPSK